MSDAGFDRFKALAAAYGAKKARWPEDSHTLYDRFASSEEAQMILAGAQQIDQFLNAWQPELHEDALADRILATLPVQQTSMSRTAALKQWSLPTMVLMLFALLGFGNGYFSTDFSELTGRDMPTAFGMVEEE